MTGPANRRPDRDEPVEKNDSEPNIIEGGDPPDPPRPPGPPTTEEPEPAHRISGGHDEDYLTPVPCSLSRNSRSHAVTPLLTGNHDALMAVITMD